MYEERVSLLRIEERRRESKQTGKKTGDPGLSAEVGFPFLPPRKILLSLVEASAERTRRPKYGKRNAALLDCTTRETQTQTKKRRERERGNDGRPPAFRQRAKE
jgi:hypothetical protein